MNRSIFRAASRHLRSANRLYKAPVVSHNTSVRAYSTVFNWEDPLAASELYTDEELAIRDTARQYCQERLLPRVLGKPYFGTICEISADRFAFVQMPIETKTMTVKSWRKWGS